MPSHDLHKDKKKKKEKGNDNDSLSDSNDNAAANDDKVRISSSSSAFFSSKHKHHHTDNNENHEKTTLITSSSSSSSSKFHHKEAKSDRKYSKEYTDHHHHAGEDADSVGGDDIEEGDDIGEEAAAVNEDGTIEDDPETARLRRKYARAVRKGKTEKAEKLRNRLLHRGVTLVSLGSTTAGNESLKEHELLQDHFFDTHNTSSSSKKGSSSSSSLSATETSKSQTSTTLHSSSSSSKTAEPVPTNPHEGMVLAKNGKWYPKPTPPPPGNTTLLLFYAYVNPPWTSRGRAKAIEYTHEVLSSNGCTGRLRVALEGFNATLTGPYDGIRNFCQALREWDPENFGNTDFKFVDGLQDNKAFKNLKVWPVMDLVNYGFKSVSAPLTEGGTHVKPDVWTEMSKDPNTVIIDVRNANETAIGWFQPPEGGATLLDPRMRRSTEFEQWVDEHMNELKDKTIMMYCTAGIRCERASALLANKGLSEIYQLEGGIHRYLDAYAEDGGIWVGKNYVFDKRFNHGAANATVVSKCSCCQEPWDRYQAQEKCRICKMEVIVCRQCQRSGKAATARLLCWLCDEIDQLRKNGKNSAADAAAAFARARSFAATGGGRDGEGEGTEANRNDDEDNKGNKFSRNTSDSSFSRGNNNNNNNNNNYGYNNDNRKNNQGSSSPYITFQNEASRYRTVPVNQESAYNANNNSYSNNKNFNRSSTEATTSSFSANAVDNHQQWVPKFKKGSYDPTVTNKRTVFDTNDNGYSNESVSKKSKI